MMESSTLVAFASQTNDAVLVQRPAMSRYVTQGACNIGSANNLTAPFYQVRPSYQFSPYQGPAPPTHRSTLFNMEYHDFHPVGHENDHGRVLSYQRYPYIEADQAPPPAQVDTQASTVRYTVSNPPFASKTIIPNETLSVGQVANFGTEVDELMKAIQRKPEMHFDVGQQPPTLGMLPASSFNLESHGTASSSANKAATKRYRCDFPNCQQSFTGKGTLIIHRRAHSGDKPYLGNLKTHRRYHTGERPFCCDKCDGQFAQRRNLRAHLQTHQGLKPYICILDYCNKTFSQLGNMKNNFYKKTLKNLTMRFVQTLNSGEAVPDADRELFEYFATHYKNSDKGIKSRGKARTVAERKLKPSQSHAAYPTTSVPRYPLPQIAPSQQIPSPHQIHGLPVSGSLAAYSMSCVQPNGISHMHRESRGWL